MSLAHSWGQQGFSSLILLSGERRAVSLLLLCFVSHKRRGPCCSQSTVDDWGAASISTLVVGLALLFAFALWESFVAKEPILPFDIWKAPTFAWVLLSAFLGFMTFGVWVICESRCRSRLESKDLSFALQTRRSFSCRFGT